MQRFLFFTVLASSIASPEVMALQLSPWQAPATGWQAYADISAWAAYDAIPVDEFGGKWGEGYAPRNGRNVFLQRNRASIGVEKEGWRVGVEVRQEGALDASRDTVDFYHLYQQRQRPDAARRFDLDARFQSWSASGLRVARTVVLAYGVQVSLSGALYGTLRHRDTAVVGNASYQGAGAYGFNAQSLESDSRYRYPFMPAASQASSGASLSVALQLPLDARWTANLAVDDLWSRLRWSNLPTVQKSIHSDVTSTDQNGYVNYQPLLTGQNSLISKSGTIGATRSASLSYRQDQWLVKLGADHLAATTIPAVAVTYHSTLGAFTGSYESRFKTVGLGYGAGPFYVQLRGNAWSVSRATSLGLNAGVRYGF
ncbi:hypothetical protein QN362_07600 [Actimicrobium sp. CCC2.4]|uniref:hypothetical protein n=1 Tax=Actimicrobium sp. CCC2.4 TaxID=3048606 RepID=UPI002AC8B6C2|nr:hypothetical protein [Actimicrobium sp. CCC2.4]MEB0135193.1 hypothetical protein [Actimicrobium sp. CCC2.4]WPX30990.1 hypothetical protein RHM62_12060 [Actimicrobium sp. CCC2.4]